MAHSVGCDLLAAAHPAVPARRNTRQHANTSVGVHTMYSRVAVELFFVVCTTRKEATARATAHRWGMHP